MARMGIPNENNFDNPYPDFHGRQVTARGYLKALSLYFYLWNLFHSSQALVYSPGS